MDLFITQNTYYFVHKHFLRFFNKKNSEVIFVKERKRGVIKKYYEFLRVFGTSKTIFCIFMEFFYMILLIKKRYNLNYTFVNDGSLNEFLARKLESNKYDRVISIGCPCLIDNNLQNVHKIKIFNLHGGIIPYQKGRFSPINSIKNNHKFLGATIHLIDKTFDNGLIISQDYFQISSKSLITNYNKVLRLSSFLLDNFLQGKYKSIPEHILSQF